MARSVTRKESVAMATLHGSSYKAVENLPYHVSVNDVSEMIVLIGTNKKSTEYCVCLLLL